MLPFMDRCMFETGFPGVKAVLAKVSCNLVFEGSDLVFIRDAEHATAVKAVAVKPSEKNRG